MQKITRLLLTVLMCTASFTFVSKSWGISIAFNDETASLGYKQALDLGQLDSSIQWFNNMEDTLLKSSFFNIGSETELNTPFYVGLGIYWGDYSSVNKSTAGIGLTVGIDHTIPHTPVDINAHVYYSPNILSFNSGEGITEYTLKAAYAIDSTSNVFLSYTNSNASFSGGVSKRHATGLQVGLDVSF